MFVSTDGRRPCRRGVIGSTVGAYPRGTGSNPVEGNEHFFPHTVSSIFRLSLTHTHTHTDTQTHTHSHTHTHTHTHTPYPRGVIGSTVGACPRGIGSNPVEGNGLFFSSNRQVYLSSFSDTLRPTQRRSLQMLDVAVPQIGVGVFHA